MTRQTSFGLLWVALLLCVPVPFFMVETGVQPTLSIAQLWAATLALVITEGSAGAVSIAIWLLGAQVFLAAVALGAAAALTTYALERLAGPRRSEVVLGMIVVLVAVCATVPVYKTPFRTNDLRATLGGVFE